MVASSHKAVPSMWRSLDFMSQVLGIKRSSLGNDRSDVCYMGVGWDRRETRGREVGQDIAAVTE